jgi:hypothetical protein
VDKVSYQAAELQKRFHLLTHSSLELIERYTKVQNGKGMRTV